MPVAWRIAAKGGAAGDIDDAAAAIGLEMLDGEAAEVGCGGEIDGERAGPGCLPVGVGSVVADALVDAGIVDQRVDAAEPT